MAKLVNIGGQTPPPARGFEPAPRITSFATNARMAGTNHHVIPQFVQGSFASRGKGGKRMTWVYRAGKEPFESNIRNVNAVRHFYGRAVDGTLDEKLTTLESTDFGNLWQELLTALPGRVGDAKRLARLVAHFETRTTHLREGLVNPIEQLLAGFMEVLTNEAEVTKRVVNWVRADPLQFCDEETVARLGGEGFARARILGMTKKELTEMVQPVVREAPARAAELIASIDVRKSMKRAHNDALKKDD